MTDQPRPRWSRAYPSQTPGAPNYMLKAIPMDIWDRVHQRRVQDGLSLRWLIISLLRAYADGHVTPQAHYDPEEIG